MDKQAGGRMGLKAYANLYEKYGILDKEAYDDEADGDWQPDADCDVSRVTMDDALTWNTKSVAYKSRAGSGGVAACKSPTAKSPTAAHAAVTFAKGTKCDDSKGSITRTRGQAKFNGGEICQWIQDRWMGGVNPSKRISMAISCVGDCTVRVATDQTHLVVVKSFEKNIVDPYQALAYAY